MTLLPREMFTSEALADLDAAVVAAGGDEMDDEEDGEVDDHKDGRDPILELEAANRADTIRKKTMWRLKPTVASVVSVAWNGTYGILW